MDDDIDIEEHDVLDNPRIKSMFPDLSCVKIEVPDDEEMDVKYLEETPEEYNENQVRYQYEYKFVTATDNVASDIPEYHNTDSNSDDVNENEMHYENGDIPQYENIDNGGPMHSNSETDNENQSYDDGTAQHDMYVVDDYCQVDCQPEYIPNKIILGSRPSYNVISNYETLYEEALNSQAMVYLDNWGERLNTSPCYCIICKTLFPTINALDAHKMVSHSFLIAVNNNTARKSTGSAYIIPPTQSIGKNTPDTGRLCNHCNNVFPNDTTLIKHLYELLPMNDFDADTPGNDARNTKVGSKIPAAEVMNSKSDDKSLIKKIGGANKFKSDVAVNKTNIVTDTEFEAKPRVARTKIAAKTAKKHGIVDTRRPYYKCTICQAVLDTKHSTSVHRTVEHPTYSKVHIYIKFYKTELKQKVSKQKGKIDRSFIPKCVLMQCGKCQLHFLSAYSALQHFIVCNKVYMSKNCTICHRNIILKDIASHYLQHDHSRDSLTVYTVTNRTIYERVLCECPKCGVCFEELRFWKHIANCDNTDYVYCNICNKKIVRNRYRSHEIKHRIKKYTKQDFIIIKYCCDKTNAAENTISEPTHVNIENSDITKSMKKTIFYCPYCHCCQHRQTLRCHSDKACMGWKKGLKMMCDKCGLMFSSKTYFVHRPLHDGDAFKLSDYEFVNIVTSNKIDPPVTPMYACKICKINFIRRTHLTTHRCGGEEFDFCNVCNKKFNPQAYLIHKEFHSDVEIMPELILKYNSLCSTWNLIYMCSECDIVCMSYDTAVEHCQKHVAYDTDTSIYCQTCNLTVHESHYKVHADLHETNSSLTMDSFKILKYDYKRIFNDDWLDFGDLTEQDIKVIMSKSVYKNVKNVKMNANGDSDAIKYYCGKCRTPVDDVETHLSVICKGNVKYRCKYCKIKIVDLYDLVTHESRHENRRSEFKIVTFNDGKDFKLNAKLRKYSSKSNKLIRKRENKKTEKEKKFKAYCCRKCNVCVTLKQNMRAHRCLPDDSKRHFCKLCNQCFTYKFRANHEIAHGKFPNLSKNTLSIIYFNDTYKKAEKLAVQDIFVTDTSDIFKIVKSKGKADTKLKLKLKKQTKKLDTRTADKKMFKVYCCKRCRVCVKWKKNTITHRCKLQRYYCKICNQYYTYNYRANHEMAHKIYPKLSKRTLAVSFFGDDPIETDKANAPDDISLDTQDYCVLYKCECDVHFDSLKSIVKHTKICKLTRTHKKVCKKCDILLPKNDYAGHLRDHNRQFTIKNVIKTNWYQCSKCEILFLTENEVGQHYDNCDPKLGVKCDKCDFKYLRNCINSHRCCENETNLYIGTVTKIKQDLKQFKVYTCTKCDINYWSMISYEKHIGRNHIIRRKKVFCDICELYYTKVSHERHYDVHKDCKEYKIQVINPITKHYKVLRGKNDEGNIDYSEANIRVANTTNESDRDNTINVTRSRKRKIDGDSVETEWNNIDFEKVNCSLKLSDTARQEENSTSSTPERDSNSIVSEAISDAVVNKKVKSLYIRYKNTLYKCPKCRLHYLHLESLKSHINRHQNKPVEHFECAECHLHFSAMILKKHTHLHHEQNKFNLEDLDIRVVDIQNGVYIDVGCQSESIDGSTIAGVSNDSNAEDESHSKVVDDSTVASVFGDGNTDIEGSIDGSRIDAASKESIISLNNDVIENDSTDASTIDSPVAIDNSKKEIRLFKCGHCNVCFIKQKECLQHVVNHVTIDSKYYISCKICNFQFMISSLKSHMEEHHENEFRLEDFVIEEYTAIGNDMDTKIEVYYAIDRVQSRLISTTTDVGKDDM